MIGTHTFQNSCCSTRQSFSPSRVWRLQSGTLQTQETIQKRRLEVREKHLLIEKIPHPKRIKTQDCQLGGPSADWPLCPAGWWPHCSVSHPRDFTGTEIGRTSYCIIQVKTMASYSMGPMVSSAAASGPQNCIFTLDHWVTRIIFLIIPSSNLNLLATTRVQQIVLILGDSVVWNVHVSRCHKCSLCPKTHSQTPFSGDIHRTCRHQQPQTAAMTSTLFITSNS